MQYIVFASIGLGLLLGAFVGYRLGRRVVSWVAKSAQHLAVVRALGGICGLLTLWPSAFVAFVVGGNLGGGWAAWLLPESVGVPLGLALGIAAVLALGLLLGSLLGALLGSGISAIVSRAHEA